MANQGQKSDMDDKDKKGDGTKDQRHEDHGQGQVNHPDTDMRLKENRDDPTKVKEHAEAKDDGK